MNIEYANLDHLSDIATLFDLYRQYYECEPDYELAYEFINARIENHESDIFVAKDGKATYGFVQLYPSFCSVQAVKIFILYDLYVAENFRNKGVGQKLMERATRWAEERGASRLDLLTAKNNYTGQHLYEKLGYKIVLKDYYAYTLDIP